MRAEWKPKYARNAAARARPGRSGRRGARRRACAAGDQTASSRSFRTRGQRGAWGILPCVEMLLATGFGVGFASVAGVRAFLPLLVAVLVVQVGFFVAPSPYDGVGEWWYVTGALAVLAVVEVALDKLRALERVFNILMVPLRAASGAVLFAAASGFDLGAGSIPWLVAGALIAGVVAVLKVVLRPSSKTPAAGVSTSFLSTFEDLVALAGGVLAVFVPFVPLAIVAFLLFFFFRVRRRRGRQYAGLRILRD